MTTDTNTPVEETETTIAEEVAAEVKEAPEVAGEEAAPEGEADPGNLGELEPNEMAIMTALTQQGRQVVLQVGQLEIQKHRVISQLAQLEQQSQQQTALIGKRLGIPEGTPWNITPDGVARLVPQPSLRSVPADGEQ